MNEEEIKALHELLEKIENHAKRVALVATLALIAAIIENCAGLVLAL